MMGESKGTRYPVRGGRLYEHDGDIHQPKTADLLINRGITCNDAACGWRGR